MLVDMSAPSGGRRQASGRTWTGSSWSLRILPSATPNRTLENSIIHSFVSLRRLLRPRSLVGGTKGRRVRTPRSREASLSAGLEDAWGVFSDRRGAAAAICSICCGLIKRTRVPRLSHFARASLLRDLAVPSAFPLRSVTFRQARKAPARKACHGAVSLGRCHWQQAHISSRAAERQSSAVNLNHPTTGG